MLTLKCYQHTPDFSNFSSGINALGGMSNPPTICGKPNVTMECNEPGQDSCVTITLTGRVPVIGEVVAHSPACSVKAACGDAIKKMTCAAIKNGTEITNCQMTCCQGDLCNKPAAVVPFPGTTTHSSAGQTTVKSSAKSIGFQASCVIFRISGVISVAFVYIFWTSCLACMALTIFTFRVICFSFLIHCVLKFWLANCSTCWVIWVTLELLKPKVQGPSATNLTGASDY